MKDREVGIAIRFLKEWDVEVDLRTQSDLIRDARGLMRYLAQSERLRLEANDPERWVDPARRDAGR